MNIAADSALKFGDLGALCDSQSSPPLNNCHFTIPANGSVEIPNPSFKYFNIAASFNHQVKCGSTKAELIVNNPTWYDILDVSVVDGFNNKVEIDATSAEDGTVKLGPPAGISGNQLLLGVYPLAVLFARPLITRRAETVDQAHVTRAAILPLRPANIR
jgi:hypothetical protein